MNLREVTVRGRSDGEVCFCFDLPENIPENQEIVCDCTNLGWDSVIVLHFERDGDVTLMECSNSTEDLNWLRVEELYFVSEEFGDFDSRVFPMMIKLLI